ncbi:MULTISPECIES: anaerobic ribonucleoside-triphosphate reductase activating protein [Altibacter]|uniref:anaerobic ribonucleoside-triphosphate reductase activating protein n=1 Tax=Altibacter TaxID=1535231 RepID=UPI00055548B7|nr:MULTISPECIES: anaerobic ribonucleoside-triphosphate reductase activating protein [Altibacter]MCW9036508.1 anaerobic ribonucleoside-triphosphate reductase activating protein [Altibacter sp.]
MYYHDFQVVLQEVPGEISLCFSISGCPLRCEGCHSPYLWKEKQGTRLTCSLFHQIVYRYKGFAGCVVFMGGEWHRKKLIKLLKIAKSEGYKTCLYTGEEEVAPEIRTQLDLLKTGRWEAARGGLDSANTNQRFTEVKTNRNLNHLFTKNSMI